MSATKPYYICKTRMQSAPEKEFQAVGIAGQIFNRTNGKFVTYFTSVPEGYLDSMDIQVCAEAPSFESIYDQAMKTAADTAAEGARVSTMCLERISWKKMLDTVLVDIDEAFSLSQQTRDNMKKKARKRFGDAVKRCLT